MGLCDPCYDYKTKNYLPTPLANTYLHNFKLEELEEIT